MGTRSRIGLSLGNGLATTIYCHWDGYPEHNGRILLESYRDNAKVAELISHGDMSSLRPKINPSSEYHTFENPEPDVCVFYHRDRDERLRISTIKEDKLWAYSGEEWNYLFKDNQWWFRRAGQTEWKLLTWVDCGAEEPMDECVDLNAADITSVFNTMMNV